MSDVPTRRRRLLTGELEAGDELSDRYRIIRRLGSGGMGSVYEAEQIKLNRRVALKIMHPERAAREKSTRRFLREARAASAIKHRNVVDILDFGELEDGTTYLVMELLEGTDLSALLRAHGPLDWPRTRGVLLQVLRGLKAAHDSKIIHRDIKPANIFLADPDDEYAADSDRVKVLDFGIARVETTGDETHELTDTAELIGTVTYMAPELARKGQATPQSDIYAVGVLAYKMLTGMTPFGGGTSLQVMYAHVHDEPPPPRSLEPSIPESVEAVILKALAKDPKERFTGADQLGRALASIDDDGSFSSNEITDALREPTFPPLDSDSLISPRSSGRMQLEGEIEAERAGKRRARVLVAAVVLTAGVGTLIWFGRSRSGTLPAQNPPVMEAAEYAEPVSIEAQQGSSETVIDRVVVGRDTGGSTEADESSTTQTETVAAESTTTGHETAGTDEETGDEPALDASHSPMEHRVSPKLRQSSTKRHRHNKPTPKASPPADPTPPSLPTEPPKAEVDRLRRIAEKKSRNCGDKHHSISSSVTLQFDITPDGKVINTHAKSPMDMTREGSCVGDEVSKLSFPKSQRGTTKKWKLPLR